MTMVRGLLIRCAFIAVGIWTMETVLLIAGADPNVELASLVAASLAGSYWMVAYCSAHEDEIPTYAARRRDHHV